MGQKYKDDKRYDNTKKNESKQTKLCGFFKGTEFKQNTE